MRLLSLEIIKESENKIQNFFLQSCSIGLAEYLTRITNHFVSYWIRFLSKLDTLPFNKQLSRPHVSLPHALNALTFYSFLAKISFLINKCTLIRLTVMLRSSTTQEVL